MACTGTCTCTGWYAMPSLVEQTAHGMHRHMHMHRVVCDAIAGGADGTWHAQAHAHAPGGMRCHRWWSRRHMACTCTCTCTGWYAMPSPVEQTAHGMHMHLHMHRVVCDASAGGADGTWHAHAHAHAPGGMRCHRRWSRRHMACTCTCTCTGWYAM